MKKIIYTVLLMGQASWAYGQLTPEVNFNFSLFSYEGSNFSKYYSPGIGLNFNKRIHDYLEIQSGIGFSNYKEEVNLYTIYYEIDSSLHYSYYDNRKDKWDVVNVYIPINVSINLYKNKVFLTPGISFGYVNFFRFNFQDHSYYRDNIEFKNFRFTENQFSFAYSLGIKYNLFSNLGFIHKLTTEFAYGTRFASMSLASCYRVNKTD